MLIKIPSRFIQQSDIDKIKEVYINTDNIVSIDLTKQVYPKWDKVNKCNIEGEFETTYTPMMQLASGFSPVLSWQMDEATFNDFISFVNEKIYLSKTKE